jgi:hypothetical protein
MKIRYIILFTVFIAFASCSKPPVKKPEVLLQENKMIRLLVDIHIAEATYINRRHRDPQVDRSSSVDFYYSVLEKHQIPDSVFEKSFVFYASQPRKFERMYRKVMNELSEMEQEFTGRRADMQELDIQRRRQ